MSPIGQGGTVVARIVRGARRGIVAARCDVGRLRGERFGDRAERMPVSPGVAHHCREDLEALRLSGALRASRTRGRAPRDTGVRGPVRMDVGGDDVLLAKSRRRRRYGVIWRLWAHPPPFGTERAPSSGTDAPGSATPAPPRIWFVRLRLGLDVAEGLERLRHTVFGRQEADHRVRAPSRVRWPRQVHEAAALGIDGRPAPRRCGRGLPHLHRSPRARPRGPRDSRRRGRGHPRPGAQSPRPARTVTPR